METTDREQTQRTFETWNRETLLEELVRRGDDFQPEALELLKAEVRRRGVSDAAVEAAHQAYRAALAKRQLPLADLAVVRTFGDSLSARAAQELLAQEGIESEVHGSDRLLFGPGLLSVGPDPITLKVVSRSAERAQEILRDFAAAPLVAEGDASAE
ncbi:MAG: DUF2007 domain-containing protein [Deltaproteobacteria bacterium]|nr:DUF2007 domain-containing protein [Deltaproteobacteria bacterium]